MDTDRFDAWTRHLSCRRAAFAGLLGGVVAIVGLGAAKTSAHNLVPACQQLKDPVKREACLRRARRHNRRQHSCKPKPKAAFCANRCGTTQNNCKKKITCTCPAGKTCLANTSCSRPCGPSVTCPPGCICQLFLAENATVRQCHSGNIITDCAQMPLPCVTSANCPRGSFCAEVSGGCGTNRCVPTCLV